MSWFSDFGDWFGNTAPVVVNMFVPGLGVPAQIINNESDKKKNSTQTDIDLAELNFLQYQFDQGRISTILNSDSLTRLNYLKSIYVVDPVTGNVLINTSGDNFILVVVAVIFIFVLNKKKKFK